MVLRDAIKASFDGVSFGGSMIFPRLVMTMADQPQERVFFCLKSADSFADCSQCEMKSRISKKRKRDERPVSCDDSTERSFAGNVSSQEPLPDTRCDLNSETEDEDRDEADERSHRDESFDLKTSREGGSARDVTTTLKFQLVAARYRRDSPKDLSQSDRIDLRTAR